jgi:hypothetical protein
MSPFARGSLNHEVQVPVQVVDRRTVEGCIGRAGRWKTQVMQAKFVFLLEASVLEYRRAPISAGTVSVVSVIRGLLCPEKKRKIKEINGS